MQDDRATDTGGPTISRGEPNVARPAMLRRILLFVVIAIVVWMGYSFGVNRGLWRAFMHPNAATAKSVPRSNASTATAPSR